MHSRQGYGGKRIATPLRPQARFERNRRWAAALSARCGALARNDGEILMFFRVPGEENPLPVRLSGGQENRPRVPAADAFFF